MLKFALLAIAVCVYASDVQEMRMINDESFVNKINAQPGLLWKV